VKRWLLSALLLFLLSVSGLAQDTGLGLLGVSKIAAGASYQGPGDLVSGATAWFGLRAYNATKASSGASTTPVVDVRGATTTTSCTIYLLGDGTGGLDFTTSGAGGVGNQCISGATTFCTVTNTSCTVSKFYDQSGNGNNAVQATAGDQPTLTFSCLGSLPCLTSSTNTLMTVSGVNSSSQPITISAVGERTSNFTSYSFFGFQDWGIGWNNVANQLLITISGAVTQASVTDNVWHSMQFVVGSNIGLIYTDGTSTGTGSVGNLANNISWTFPSSGHPILGKFAELGLWSAAFTGTTSNNSLQTNQMCHNQYAYWGLPNSC
jgi:hypothetical protein